MEDMIPIYLIVAASAGLFNTCCSSALIYQSGDDKQTLNPFRGLIQLFQFAWFIAGNVWIYSIYEPNYTDPSNPDFCNKTLYLFAFCVTNSGYIFFGDEMVITFLIMGINAYAISARLPPTNQSRNNYVFSRNDWRTILPTNQGTLTASHVMIGALVTKIIIHCSHHLSSHWLKAYS